MGDVTVIKASGINKEATETCTTGNPRSKHIFPNFPHDSLQCYQECKKEEELLEKKNYLVAPDEERSSLMRIMEG